VTIRIEILIEGLSYSIYEIIENDNSEIQHFLSKMDAVRRGKLIQKIKYIAENGPPKNTEKFNHEGDGIYAIKSDDARLYCFFDKGKMILLTHGIIKKRQKLKPIDLKKAKTIREKYLNRIKL
jgi:mRNA-degrading endonuclease RelE of RelBE toxin-antitoxin system